MSTDAVTLREHGFAKTQRRDAWWAGPLATGLVLGGFVIYTTFRIFQNAYFQYGEGTGPVELHDHAHVLSPMYSPLLPIQQWLPWLPTWISPAMFILWMPGGFRLTCYYYRKAYYRAFFLDPVACAVGEPRDEYKGETHLLLFQNIHRYFLYVAIVFIFILGWDAIKTFRWPAGEDGFTLGMSVGSIVLTTAVVLLALYTFSCHSLRHLVGGNVDCFSCVRGGQARYKAWRGVTRINEHHMFWAWTSLFGVTFADLYVYLVSARVISDPILFVLR
jgi:hypothetical protein